VLFGSFAVGEYVVLIAVPRAGLVIRIRAEELALLAGLGDPHRRYAAVRPRLFVMAGPGAPPVTELGVARISLGSSIAQAANARVSPRHSSYWPTPSTTPSALRSTAPTSIVS